MAPTKEKLTYKTVGRSIICVIDKEKLVFTSADTKSREKLVKEIDAFNLRPSKERKDKIVKLFKPKTEKEKVIKVAKKKATKNKIKEVKREMVAPKKALKKLKEHFKGEKRIIVDQEGVKMDGFDVVMPEMLVNTIGHALDNKEDITPLLNFWMLTLLNPNPVAREKLFGYVSRHKLIVTPNGYIVTYRMVKTTDQKGVFTHAHEVPKDDPKSPRMYYRIGEVAKLDRATQCDEDGGRDCSRGLHTGTPDFIGINLGDGYKQEITKSQGGGYGTGYDSPRTNQSFSTSFGNQAVIVLLNPMHVVSVPNTDTRKLRACELYFCKETTAEEVIKLQTSEYHIFDNQYKAFELEQLKEMLKKAKLDKFVESSRKAKSPEELEIKIAKLKESLSVNSDKINGDLTLEEINRVIQSRILKASKIKK